MRKISPGFIWLALLAWAIYSVIAKYMKDTLFRYGAEYGIFLALLIVSTIYTFYYDKNKNKTTAVISFIFSLTFWIPLINLIFCAISLYLGKKSWHKMKHDPKKFGGKWFIVVSFILSIIVYLTYLTGVGMCIFGLKSVCENIGLTFLAD